MIMVKFFLKLSWFNFVIFRTVPRGCSIRSAIFFKDGCRIEGLTSLLKYYGYNGFGDVPFGLTLVPKSQLV